MVPYLMPKYSQQTADTYELQLELNPSPGTVYLAEKSSTSNSCLTLFICAKCFPQHVKRARTETSTHLWIYPRWLRHMPIRMLKKMQSKGTFILPLYAITSPLQQTTMFLFLGTRSCESSKLLSKRAQQVITWTNYCT